jgi:homoserine kinase type II
MLQFKELNPDNLFDMLARSEELKKNSETILATMDQALIRSLITEVVSLYEIGTVIDVYEIFGGYVNRSFGVYTNHNGQTEEYFIRMYKKGVTDKEIQFEHSLIDFIKENGLQMAAGIHRSKEGKSYIKRRVGTGAGAEERYFAVYEYLQGEDKYTWINNIMNDKEYESAAQVLASFHNAARKFEPNGLERVEPKIIELIPTLKDTFKGYAETAWQDKFTEYFHKNLASILEVIDRTRIPAEEYAKMPMNPIHCDFHPGNMKYQNNVATGIFDFDWSKIDLRLFDIGLGLVYCCSCWVDELDGTLMLEQCKIFLQAYQNKLKELGELEPLNETEKKYLPTLLTAGNMYLVFWALRDYYSNLGDLNVYEYLNYLQHLVKLMNWIENHNAEIMAIANEL